MHGRSLHATPSVASLPTAWDRALRSGSSERLAEGKCGARSVPDCRRQVRCAGFPAGTEDSRSGERRSQVPSRAGDGIGQG